MNTDLQFDDEQGRRLDALYRTKDAVERRRIVLDALGLGTGERVLDIGTGPGFLAAEMAECVGPSGQVCGIDLSEPMLEIARRRCEGKPWVRFGMGDALALPVADAGFDVAVSVQVHEYVVDTMKALSEMYRVLRPGGRGAIVSTDWAAIAWHSSDEARMKRVLDAFSNHCAFIALPRTLASRLRGTGFVVKAQRVIPQFNSIYDPDSYSYRLIPIIGSFVSGRFGVTAEEVDEWGKDLQQMGQQGEYFFSLNGYLHLAIKPE
uniref:Methyltransferase domain-containing protein n=1 Tax=Candidatus Kentrum eta TaxID=2126337 RepID=A0A450VCW9_9GAMM|nr:MAG: Methyltransferase domain-containing protein [Candidatus Kentron sp. H]VFJ96915.1 MAG: Methyltransferase domain-containing protein [Candidatus Kentron sp. H]VFK02591.1 MAG: Methyltransferase domain-containing protein [Candidatus Kentron sp. H]